MGKPQRIQLSRRKGWRMPENTVSVARPGRWGNPFVIGELTHVWHKSGAWPYNMYRDSFRVAAAWHAVRLFSHAMRGDPEWHHETWRAPDVTPLRGKNLACWCPLDQPCHADVLLELANAEVPS